jgi:hypothetical protein
MAGASTLENRFGEIERRNSSVTMMLLKRLLMDSTPQP